MKFAAMLALTLALLLTALTPNSAHAQAVIDGVVTKVDTSAGKITIRHGPIKKLDMDESMTMIFTAKDAGLLSNVKAGDKIKFDAENVKGQYIVTAIEKAK